MKTNMNRNITEIPETFWAYFAGMVDGEGYLKIWHIKQNKVKRGYAREYRLAIGLGNKEPLEQMRAKLGMGKIYAHYRQPDQTEESLSSYDLRFWAGDCRVILPKIMPYLIQKKRLAEIMIQCLNSIREEEQILELEKAFNYEFYHVIHKDNISKGWHSKKRALRLSSNPRIELLGE
jgi:hypothetical protein